MSDIYIKRSLETWHNGDVPHHLQIIHATLGLVGEAGEFSEMIKKGYFKPDYDMWPDLLIDELGDVFYYITILAHLLGYSIEEMSRYNHDKLKGGHGWKPGYINELFRNQEP